MYFKLPDTLYVSFVHSQYLLHETYAQNEFMFSKNLLEK